jgi:hypothetical protein
MANATPYGERVSPPDTLRVRVASLKQIRQLPGSGKPSFALVSPPAELLALQRWLTNDK